MQVLPELSGTDRAALLLLALGEDNAAEILKHMGPKEVQKVGSAMAALNNVQTGQLSSVLRDFTVTVQNQTAIGIGTEDYIRNVMVGALGEDKAKGVMDRILMTSNSKGLEALKWMDARSVADLIKVEHPQIQAIVLAYLEQDQAAEIIGYLPESVRADVVLRIATLDGVQPSALKELDEVFERQFSGSQRSQGILGRRCESGRRYPQPGGEQDRKRSDGIDQAVRRGAGPANRGLDVRVRQSDRTGRPRNSVAVA